ncbi:MAG: hypothetical protein AUG51_22465 [Acidobacteria bacterium 13_1_20CM_3_53_8]|nr:MAG: hypothetical protein AUG51_22465 [Acidobacteria bacterium 13_1_20CM_3_53_8]
MNRIIIALFFILFLSACVDTQTCRVTGLVAHEFYEYTYTGSDGNTVNGSFEADDNGNHDIANVSSGVNCGDIRTDMVLVGEVY